MDDAYKLERRKFLREAAAAAHAWQINYYYCGKISTLN